MFKLGSVVYILFNCTQNIGIIRSFRNMKPWKEQTLTAKFKVAGGGSRGRHPPSKQWSAQAEWQ